MSSLIWQLDELTATWTRRLPIAEDITISSQFSGREMDVKLWQSYISDHSYPDFCYMANDKLLCSPENIIQCFAKGHMIQGLALTVAWGGMARTRRKIYASGTQAIDDQLQECARLISDSNSLETAWKRLIGNLGWSDVISSKTLHFLCRSLGYDENPGVAIDTAVVLNEFGYYYDDMVRRAGGNPKALGCWRDRSSLEGSWAAYNRYMTAICCWADMQGWTTTQVEATLFVNPISFLGER
jgi:hypothetical protein